MARPKDQQRRDELLAAVIDTFAARGIGTRSLRDIAEAVGSSHRMLIHHFSSRERLLVAVVEEMEARQRQWLELADAAAADVLTGFWTELSSEDVRPFERLFFECYARGAQGEAPFDQLHPRSVESWLELSAAGGVDPVFARLGLAVVRGLLLDLVATNDTAATGRALALFATLVGPHSGDRLRDRRDS